MDGKALILIACIAVSYYFFSREFFQFASEIKKKEISRGTHFICFFIVFLWFLAASLLELPLVVNWLVFLILLGLEVRIVFSFDFLVSYGLALFCVIMGLAVNVFFRSAASILLKIPLYYFDNVKYSIKSYPILLGFLVMVLFLHVLRRIHFSAQLERMLHYRKSLVFYTWSEFFIYLFLVAQLLAYTQSGNEAGIKTWGIKSALFSVFALMITIIYSLRVASLHYYMEKQHEIRSHLIQEKQDINMLWKLAYTDMLTGFHNRQLLEKRLEEYAGYGCCITLAFIDVNGLKSTNDRYGHMVGDSYLIKVTRILAQVSDGLNIDLFRYGGDEFIMLSNTRNVKEIEDLLVRANELLISEQNPDYSRSISFGIVHGDCSGYQKLIADADNLMYQYKTEHYQTMARY